MKKYGYCLIVSVILAAIMVFVLLQADIYPENQYPLAFSIEQEGHQAAISIHESDDGTYYAFLPSYAEMADVKIVMSLDSKVLLGGTTVTSGMSCEAFELETPYCLSVDDQDIAQLQFYRSANVATMYIDTVTGSMDRVHKDKEYSEQASVMLYTAEGIRNASDSAAYIKGRGNATWSYGKRPYLLTLSSDVDLLGMGAATKWVLLANATDATNLNNKLVFDLARQTGTGWSPDNAFVDVYLNGEYRGLYLLTEKVEVGPSRLDIDQQSGDFLCKADINQRWLDLRNPIKTQSGRTVEITNPESITDLSETTIKNAVNQMEQIIMSGADLSGIESFALDSWVQKYLIDEISANADADVVSSYFYYSDGVFYGGPMWDYDMAFGNNLRNPSPTGFYAKNTYKSDSYISLYYAALYENESFRNRMLERYQTDFLPLLNQLTDSGISDLAAEIQSASTMNYLCWQTMFDIIWGEDRRTVHSVDGLISFLEDRVAFLNSAWLEGTQYCMIQIGNPEGSPYANFCVKKGDLFVTEDIDLENTVWIDKATGGAVDFRQPVLSDMILMKQSDLNVQVMDLDTKKLCVGILGIGLFLIFLFCLVYIDIRLRRRERRGTGEQERKHISP